MPKLKKLRDELNWKTFYFRDSAHLLLSMCDCMQLWRAVAHFDMCTEIQ